MTMLSAGRKRSVLGAGSARREAVEGHNARLREIRFCPGSLIGSVSPMVGRPARTSCGAPAASDGS